MVMDRVLEIILALTLLGAVLAFGGVQPLTYALMEFALFLAVLLLLWKQTRQAEIVLRLPVWPVLFALWALLQLVPFPSFFVGWISPARLLSPNLGDVSHGQWV